MEYARSAVEKAINVQKKRGVEGLLKAVSIPDKTYQFSAKNIIAIVSKGITFSFLFMIRLKLAKVPFEG
jgi:hypothetical protein